MNNSPDWSSIDTVLLDMDGTLLDLHFDNFFWLTHLPQRYAEHHGICPNQATKDLHRLFNEKRGTLEWYCIEYWSRQLAIDIATIKQEVTHLIRERPFVQQFLTALGEKNIQRILITNAHPRTLAIKLEVTRIAERLDAIISSHEYGHAKESPLFWERLQKEHSFTPSNALFIDDSEQILAAAEDFGISNLVWMRQPDSREQPKEHGQYLSIVHFDELLTGLA